MKKTIGIVEDDVFIASDLAEMLEEMNYEVVWTVHSPSDAITQIKINPPGLILMDIHLNEVVDGIHLAGIIKSEYKIPVIFTTAFSDPATLQRVKNVSPFGYVVKPYTASGIRIAIELAFARTEEETEIKKDEPDNAIFINSTSGMVRVNNDEIWYIEAFDYYANIFTANGKILAKMTLGEVLDSIKNEQIVRVHKSFAVHISHIGKIKNNEIHIGDKKIPIGRAYKEDLKNRIKIL